MKRDVLCALISKRIDPSLFQLRGTEVHWTSKEYDTEENNKIVEDVVSNYDSLVLEYELKEKKSNVIKLTKEVLTDIDISSIRSIREWVISKAPYLDILKKKDADAAANRNSIISKKEEVLDYAAKRRAEYPSVEDQLDAIWKGEPFTTQMRYAIWAVKDKYPKR